jgi:large subunit ribosomal protein L22
MEVKAKARYLRMSPKKVRLVIDLIRGLDVQAARTQLRFQKKAAAIPVLKLLESAVANAKHNFNLDEKDLCIKTIMADGGPTLHRWRPRAFGRSAPIRKRTTHLSIVLSEKEVPAKKEKTNA